MDTGRNNGKRDLTGILTKEDVERRLIDAIVELEPRRKAIRLETTFAKLGLDSRDLVKVSRIAAELWGVELERGDLENLTTVGDAVDLVYAHILDRVLE